MYSAGAIYFDHIYIKGYIECLFTINNHRCDNGAVVCLGSIKSTTEQCVCTLYHVDGDMS